MINKQSLLNDLEKLEINPKGTLMVHSSYKKIGDVENGADTVIDALMEYMRNGLLVVPTHTWDNIKENISPTMDVLHTSVCIGIIPELYRKRSGVIRSLHPTHSVGAFGKESSEFVKGEEQMDTPCGRNSVYGKLLDRNAQILLIGVDYTRNTYIHGVEEWYDIPNRVDTRKQDLYVIDADGKTYHTPQRRHCARLGSKTYWKIEPLMKRERVMREGRFGEAVATVTDAKRLYEVLGQMLAIDRELLSDQSPLDSSWDRMKFKKN